MLGGLGGTEIILILLVVILLFGADKIPELARGLGKGMQEFQKASDSIKKEIDNTKKNFSEPPKKQKADTEVKEEVIEDAPDDRSAPVAEKKPNDETEIKKDKSKKN